MTDKQCKKMGRKSLYESGRMTEKKISLTLEQIEKIRDFVAAESKAGNEINSFSQAVREMIEYAWYTAFK